MGDAAKTASGGCYCGAVRFRVTLPSRFCAHCHCDNCRRAHGSAFVTWAGFVHERFEITSGADALRRFETDGGIPIDNMAAEHNFVPVALTRKNFLFAGSDAGAERAAIVYTVLRCCRLAGVEPFEYLSDVLAVLSRKIRRVDVPQLMPREWAQRHAVAV